MKEKTVVIDGKKYKVVGRHLLTGNDILKPVGGESDMLKEIKEERVRLSHRAMTDEECYQAIKSNPGVFSMSAEQWKRRRLRQLKREGKS